MRPDIGVARINSRPIFHCAFVADDAESHGYPETHMTKKLLAALFVYLVGTASAHATAGPGINSWTGASGDDWNATTWSLMGSPVAGAKRGAPHRSSATYRLFAIDSLA